MNISRIHIENFRKLKSCRIDFGEKETIFVGANNSGKTSAKDALSVFLKRKENFKTQDFTITSWSEIINQLGNQWVQDGITEELLSYSKWDSVTPQLDIWFEVSSSELHYVNHIIPTLDWTGGKLGVRLKFEPKNIKWDYLMVVLKN